MKHTSYKAMDCGAAQALECVGEWWSILILRDAFLGLSRFDEFQTSLGIASNSLTRRLKHLTENGLLDRRIYSERPKRYEYILTERGRDFFPVLVTLTKWGNQHLAPNGAYVQLADRLTGKLLEPILMDKSSLLKITYENVTVQPGPGATEEVLARLATRKVKNEQ
ncbi:MAG: helix-turn-helix transcriptional regulator [Methylotenera sp.]|nr:helix-turn-helix transcriptional regulator [Methylotenera sp.]